MTTEAPPDLQGLMSRIRAKTDGIMRLRARRDAGKFKSVGAAIGLQALENERAQLQRQLPPLREVSE